MKQYISIIFLVLTILPGKVLSKAASGFSYQILGGFNTASQDDMNSLIQDAVMDESAVTPQLENAYEIGAAVEYRTPSFFSIGLRPLYFFESTK